jgi:hypothetical protein
MTSKQSLRLAANMIRASVPDLRCLLDLLEIAGQTRLATELRKQAPELPKVQSSSRPHCDQHMWLSGRVR